MKILIALVVMKPMRLFLLLLVCVVVSLSLAQEPEVSDEYKQLYREAIELFNQQKYEGALAKLEEGIVLEPQASYAYNLAGAAHVKMENYEQAAASFQKILMMDPKNSTAIFNYGEALFLAKNYPEAKVQFENYMGTEGNQTNALARYKVILCDLLGGNEAGASEAVAELRPTISHPLEYYGRAALQFHAGNDKEARNYLQSAFKIYPGGMNLAFADSMVEIGWLDKGDVAQIGVVNAAALQSLSTEFQPESGGEKSDSFKDNFESLLPSLGGDKDDKN